MKKNTLNKEVWKYFLIFSILILTFLWTFQVIFFDKYYKYVKIQDIKSIATTIEENKTSPNLTSIINYESLKKEVCVEVTNSNAHTIYSSSFQGKGCLNNTVSQSNYKQSFINSNENSTTYEIKNSILNNNSLVQAIKLNNNTYAFINTSLVAVDQTVSIMKNQLIVITLIVLVLSFVLSYFISNHISSPIIKINNTAKKLAKGEFDIEFDTTSPIEEIKELSTTLNYAKEELSKTDELRRDLMANVSHDLKTPLTLIKAYAEMSQDLHQNNKEKQQDDMKIIIDETDRLSILVNDILTLSKLQQNIESLNIVEFNLIELIDNVLEKYKVLEELENYNFIFTHKQKEIKISADKKQLEQVIYNLINNAINYTGEDKKVFIKVLNTNNTIRVEIKDTGKGIKEEDLNLIWDKYYKNNKNHKRNVIGTGLGLSIVKNILISHNFNYGVETKLNHGTTFYFEIKRSTYN